MNDALEEARKNVADLTRYALERTFLSLFGLTCVYALPNSETSGKAGMVEVYQTFLKVGKAKKTCQACNRHMDDRELGVFEKYVSDGVCEVYSS